MSWPMFFIMVLNFLVGLTDVYVAGLISPEVQAAVGFVGQLYFIIIIIANAISIGTLAMVSRAFGSGNVNSAVDITRQSLLLSFAVAAALTFPAMIFHRQIIAAAGFPPGIREIAEQFLKVFSLALGPNYILIISNASFRATGEVKKPLFTMLVVSVINIVGDIVLVLGVYPFPRLGYMGIAVSTAASVTIGMFINLFFFSLDHWKPLYSGSWRIAGLTVSRIAKIAWPSALLQAAWNAGTMILYNILGQLGSASITGMAAITNGLRIEAVIYMPAFALNMAASVLVGQSLGAGHTKTAERTGWKITQAGVAIISLMSMGIFIFAERLASMLTNDPLVLNETARYLRYNMLSEPFMAVSTILGGSLQGAGDTKGTMMIIISTMWFIRLPLAYLLAIVLKHGPSGVWLAMITSMAFQGVFMAVRFHRGHWKRIEVV